MTASSSGCTPLFLNAEPSSTGVTVFSSVAAAQGAPDHLGRDRLLVRRGTSPSARRRARRPSRSAGGGTPAPAPQLGRDLARSPSSCRGRRPGDRAHLDEVDDAAVVLLLADRQLHRHRVRAEAVDHRLHGGEEVRAGAVHLVDEGDARDAVARRPGARRSRTAAGRRRPRRRRRSRRRGRAGCAPPRP